MNERFEAERCIDPGHPALAGHFPGNSVVPGVVLLDAVREVLGQWLPGFRIAELIQTKFLYPLRPGIRFKVRLGRTKSDAIRFDCLLEDVRFASGLLLTEKVS
ncbi:MAG: hydroxymyristoyl-ACP dehydratase [Pseudomonadota bacterium]